VLICNVQQDDNLSQSSPVRRGHSIKSLENRNASPTYE